MTKPSRYDYSLHPLTEHMFDLLLSTDEDRMQYESESSKTLTTWRQMTASLTVSMTGLTSHTPWLPSLFSFCNLDSLLNALITLQTGAPCRLHLSFTLLVTPLLRHTQHALIRTHIFLATTLSLSLSHTHIISICLPSLCPGGGTGRMLCRPYHNSGKEWWHAISLMTFTIHQPLASRPPPPSLAPRLLS